MTTAIINDDDLQLGPCNAYRYPKAVAVLAVTMTTGVNNAFKLTARKGGVAGNSITITILGGAGTNTLAVSVAGTDITVQAATSGGLITSTARQVCDAINAHPGAFGLAYAALSQAAGTGAVTAVASTPLASGSDTETETFLGGLGEGTVFHVMTEAKGLTAAQSGNVVRKKIITGGGATLDMPLKEITLENFELAVGNAVLLEGFGGKQRLEFIIAVGQDLMAMRGQKIALKKIIGQAESTDPKDTLIIPRCYPADATIDDTYHPTEQRVLNAKWEAAPDARGMLAYFGDAEL